MTDSVYAAIGHPGDTVDQMAVDVVSDLDLTSD